MAELIKSTLENIVGELSNLFKQLDEAELENLLHALTDDGALFVAGAGRSGLMLRGFAMRLMHMGKRVYMIGEATTPSAQAGDALLIGSGSGETGSLVVMAKKAKDIGVKVALVTTNPASTIAKMADVVVTIPGPTPKAVGNVRSAPSRQPMGSLFEQGMLLLLDGLVMQLMQRKGIASDEMFKRHANLE